MSLALQSKGREQPGAQGVLGATVKSSFLHGTLWVGAAWEGGACHFHVPFLSHCSVWGTPSKGVALCVYILTTASNLDFTFLFIRFHLHYLSSK